MGPLVHPVRTSLGTRWLSVSELVLVLPPMPPFLSQSGELLELPRALEMRIRDVQIIDQDFFLRYF